MITYCIPSKNNLRYLKSSVESIKANSSCDYNIIVYIDADNDGTEQWLIDNDVSYLKNESDTPKGIAYGYNRCIEAATTDIVCMFHADMYMAKGFDTGILKLLKPRTVVAGTRIEPPLHPPGHEKIVKDFGMYPESFDRQGFEDYCANALQSNQGKTTKGIFAPWAMFRQDILSIGMHDECFHSYHEDSDIFNRFVLKGYDIIQTWESLVYHLTCRGGQFQDGIEQVTTDEAFHQMKSKAMRHYLRKWGSWIENNEYHYPVIAPKYDIGFVVSNCGLPILEMLEPWCSTIYVKDHYDLITPDYIKREQPSTLYDLQERIKPYDNEKHNNILISFDASKIAQQSFRILQQLPQIIKESGEIGTFELDIFTIDIIHMNEYQNDLIVCNTI